MIQWGVIRYWLLIPLLSVGAASSRTTQNYFHSIKDRRLGKTYPPTAATVPYQSSSCVTDVAGLLSAVRSLSSGTNNSSTILVCAESIIFSDATGKNINASLILASSNTYDFQCTLPSPQRCVWDGKNITRFLYGINVVVTFTRFDFVDGSSRQDTIYDETAGGALYFKKSTLTLNDCRFFGNKADFGGAIFLQESVLYLKGPNLFQNNSARISGGAIYLEESSRLLSTSALTEFKLNRAMFASAIRGSENSSIDLKRASFVENRAWDVRYESTIYALVVEICIYRC